VHERAQSLLHLLLCIRVRCGGDEGLALALRNAEDNVAVTALQTRHRLKSVHQVSESERDELPELQDLILKPWGGAFKAPGLVSHKKGGVKEAIAILCGLGIAFKTQYTQGGLPDRREICLWTVDEVYAFVPLVHIAPESRVRTHLRLAPTRSLLRLISSHQAG
jgi:hypothetical protein